MFSLIYLWRDGKDILNGLFVAFPIMYILLGLISSDKKELLDAFNMIDIMDISENYTYEEIMSGSKSNFTIDIDADWAENNNSVIFCGRTNMVEKYLAASDCYVLPSYREGFGLAVIEAEAEIANIQKKLQELVQFVQKKNHEIAAASNECNINKANFDATVDFLVNNLAEDKAKLTNVLI